jgi:SsrA-binding protein
MAQNKKTPTTTKAIVNRRARYDYALDDELVVGLELTGQEARAARDGHVQLRGAYVSVKANELWLTGASFSLKLNEKGNPGGRSIDTRSRRLLAHRKQIDALNLQRKNGHTIVPLRLVIGGRHIKLVIALGKGKRSYDKRETIKRRDQDRDTERALARA